MVLLAADQTAEALTQLDRCLGQLIIDEGISSGLADGFQPGLQQRMIRHAERQLGDDHVLQRLARHVDALPETVGSEQDRAGMGLELLQHLVTRHAFRLAVQGQLLLGQPGRQVARGAAHHFVAGEQDKRSTVRPANIAADHADAVAFELGALTGRIRHVRHQDQPHLTPVIERAVHTRRARLRQPDPGLEEIKRCLTAHRECRAGQDHAARHVEQLFAQGGADIDRCR